MNLKKTAAALAIGSLLALTACGNDAPAATESTAAATTLTGLYEAAKTEGALQIYGPTEDLYKAVYADFAKAYPGITITTADIFGQELDARLEGEQIAGGFAADLLHIGVSDMGRYATKEYLASYKPAEAEALDAKFRGTDDKWSVPSRHLYATAYNTKNLTADQVPTSWADLIDPKWKGELGVANPKQSGVTPQVIAAALEAGAIDEAWLNTLKDDIAPAVYPSVATALQAVVTGENDLSLVAGYGSFMRQVKQGAPVGFATMDDGAYYSDVAYGLLDGSKHPNAARLLVAWMYSAEGQASIAKNVYEFGTMPQAPLPEGADKLGQSAEITYPGPEKYRSTLDLLNAKF
ncbi:iron(III) transport system substrate-binding protein [Arthrobacter ginsengisoli]|uniref:Iron(III) transport system substrate-binding protein n=1 Tax=Arthrobacter ginsengisoli TaxID=1356565 RepID=A0ABU1UDY1_9MICC|nr:extracellular solute-binding protein [Arthrobacter ginsengisoli]MDR7083387.1 iron(III) transport system substrate-binding protein [Arthrobacter ginsengisoli]